MFDDLAARHAVPIVEAITWVHVVRREHGSQLRFLNHEGAEGKFQNPPSQSLRFQIVTRPAVGLPPDQRIAGLREENNLV